MPITTEFLEISDSRIVNFTNNANAAAGCAMSLSGNAYARVTGITQQGSFAWARNETALHEDSVFNPDQYFNGVGVNNTGTTFVEVNGDASNYSGRVCVGNYDTTLIGPHLDAWAYTPRETVGGFNTGNTIYSTVKVAKTTNVAFVPCANSEAGTCYVYWTPDITAGGSVQWYQINVGAANCPIGVSFGMNDDGSVVFMPRTGLAPVKIWKKDYYLNNADVYIDSNVANMMTQLNPGAVYDGYTLQSGSRFILAGQADPTQNGYYLVNSGGGMPSRFITAANLILYNFHIVNGAVYGGKDAECKNLTVPTYGVDAITMAITSGYSVQVIGATAYYATALSSDAAIQMAVLTSDKTKIYTSPDWSTFTLKKTHTGQVDCLHNINTTKFLATSLGGGLIKSNDSGVTWNTLIPTRKHHFVASNLSGDKIIAIESGNATDYCNVYDVPVTSGTTNHAIYITDGSTPRHMAPNGTISAWITL